ncbi:unnamed protein product, partial [Meganyctiphanes norvegica]
STSRTATQTFPNMKYLVCLLLVGVVSCSSLLKDLPPNTDVNYIYENNKLVAVKIDYSDDLRPVVKTAVKKTVPIAAAPKPVVKMAGASKTYYKVDDGELESVKPTHVGYSTLPKSSVAPVVKSAPVSAAPVAAAPEPLVIAGPKIVLTLPVAPTVRPVIIRGPQVIYKRGPAPVAAPAPVPAPVAKSAPAVPAPAPSPLIKTFYKKDDGELEKIKPTHVSYSFVKSAPAAVAVPVAVPVPAHVPVVAPAPVVYRAPTPVVKATPLDEDSVEEEDDD